MCCRSCRSSWQACSMFYFSVLDIMTQYLYQASHKSASGKIPGSAVRPAGQSSQQRKHSSRPAARRAERQRKHTAAPAMRCREAVTFCKRNRLFRPARPSCSRCGNLFLCWHRGRRPPRLWRRCSQPFHCCNTVGLGTLHGDASPRALQHRNEVGSALGAFAVTTVEDARAGGGSAQASRARAEEGAIPEGSCADGSS